MYITKEKFEEICKRHRSLLLVDGDAAEAFAFVQEVLEAEAEAVKRYEPDATYSIQKLSDAAYQVYDVGEEVENEEFLEKEESLPKSITIAVDELDLDDDVLEDEGPRVVRTMDDLRDYLEDKGWWFSECSYGNGGVGWEVGQSSPAGEDFFFSFEHNNDVETAIKEIKGYAYDFDIEEHVKLNLGMSGAPGIVELVEDAKEIQKMLDELADGVDWGEQKTIGETLAEAMERSEENQGFNAYDEIQRLTELRKERPLTEEEEETLFYCKNATAEQDYYDSLE